MARRTVVAEPVFEEPQEEPWSPAAGFYSAGDVSEGAVVEESEPQPLSSLMVANLNTLIYLVGEDGVPQLRELRPDGNVIALPGSRK